LSESLTEFVEVLSKRNFDHPWGIVKAPNGQPVFDRSRGRKRRDFDVVFQILENENFNLSSIKEIRKVTL